MFRWVKEKLRVKKNPGVSKLEGSEDRSVEKGSVEIAVEAGSTKDLDSEVTAENNVDPCMCDDEVDTDSAVKADSDVDPFKCNNKGDTVSAVKADCDVSVYKGGGCNGGSRAQDVEGVAQVRGSHRKDLCSGVLNDSRTTEAVESVAHGMDLTTCCSDVSQTIKTVESEACGDLSVAASDYSRHTDLLCTTSSLPSTPHVPCLNTTPGRVDDNSGTELSARTMDHLASYKDELSPQQSDTSLVSQQDRETPKADIKETGNLSHPHDAFLVCVETDRTNVALSYKTAKHDAAVPICVERKETSTEESHNTETSHTYSPFLYVLSQQSTKPSQATVERPGDIGKLHVAVPLCEETEGTGAEQSHNTEASFTSQDSLSQKDVKSPKTDIHQTGAKMKPHDTALRCLEMEGVIDEQDSNIYSQNALSGLGWISGVNSDIPDTGSKHPIQQSQLVIESEEIKASNHISKLTQESVDGLECNESGKIKASSHLSKCSDKHDYQLANVNTDHTCIYGYEDNNSWGGFSHPTDEPQCKENTEDKTDHRKMEENCIDCNNATSDSKENVGGDEADCTRKEEIFLDSDSPSETTQTLEDKINCGDVTACADGHSAWDGVRPVSVKVNANHEEGQGEMETLGDTCTEQEEGNKELKPEETQDGVLLEKWNSDDNSVADTSLGQAKVGEELELEQSRVDQLALGDFILVPLKIKTTDPGEGQGEVEILGDTCTEQEEGDELKPKENQDTALLKELNNIDNGSVVKCSEWEERKKEAEGPTQRGGDTPCTEGNRNRIQILESMEREEEIKERMNKEIVNGRGNESEKKASKDRKDGKTHVERKEEEREETQTNIRELSGTRNELEEESISGKDRREGDIEGKGIKDGNPTIENGERKDLEEEKSINNEDRKENEIERHENREGEIEENEGTITRENGEKNELEEEKSVGSNGIKDGTTEVQENEEGELEENEDDNKEVTTNGERNELESKEEEETEEIQENNEEIMTDGEKNESEEENIDNEAGGVRVREMHSQTSVREGYNLSATAYCLPLSSQLPGCLYNQIGKVCTVLDECYILTQVNSAPLLVSTKIENSGMGLLGVALVWCGNRPLALGELPDGTIVYFDAIFLSRTSKYVALMVWQKAKPVFSIEPYFNLYVFVEEFDDLRVRLVSFSKETGVFACTVNGKEQLVAFSKSVVFISGQEIEKRGEIMKFLKGECGELYASVWMLVTTGCGGSGSYQYGFMCSCLWSGIKPKKQKLDSDFNRLTLYQKCTNIKYYPAGKKQFYMHSDAPVDLVIKEGEYSLVYQVEKKSWADDRDDDDKQTVHIPCSRKIMYCGDRWATASLSGQVKAHVRRTVGKDGREVWTAAMVQLPESLAVIHTGPGLCGTCVETVVAQSERRCAHCLLTPITCDPCTLSTSAPVSSSTLPRAVSTCMHVSSISPNTVSSVVPVIVEPSCGAVSTSVFVSPEPSPATISTIVPVSPSSTSHFPIPSTVSTSIQVTLVHEFCEGTSAEQEMSVHPVTSESMTPVVASASPEQEGLSATKVTSSGQETLLHPVLKSTSKEQETYSSLKVTSGEQRTSVHPALTSTSTEQEMSSALKGTSGEQEMPIQPVLTSAEQDTSSTLMVTSEEQETSEHPTLKTQKENVQAVKNLGQDKGQDVLSHSEDNSVPYDRDSLTVQKLDNRDGLVRVETGSELEFNSDGGNQKRAWTESENMQGLFQEEDWSGLSDTESTSSSHNRNPPMAQELDATKRSRLVKCEYVLEPEFVAGSALKNASSTSTLDSEESWKDDTASLETLDISCQALSQKNKLFKNCHGTLYWHSEMSMFVIMTEVEGLPEEISIGKRAFFARSEKLIEVVRKPVPIPIQFDGYLERAKKVRLVAVWRGKKPIKVYTSSRNSRYCYDVEGVYRGCRNNLWVFYVNLDGETRVIKTECTNAVYLAEGQRCSSIPVSSHVTLHLKENLYPSSKTLWVALLVVVGAKEGESSKKETTVIPETTSMNSTRTSRHHYGIEGVYCGPYNNLWEFDVNLDGQIRTIRTESTTAIYTAEGQHCTPIPVSSCVSLDLKETMYKGCNSYWVALLVVVGAEEEESTKKEISVVPVPKTSSLNFAPKQPPKLFKNCKGTMYWDSESRVFMIGTATANLPSEICVGKNGLIIEGTKSVFLEEGERIPVQFDVHVSKNSYRLVAIWKGKKPSVSYNDFKTKKFYFDVPGVYHGKNDGLLMFDVSLDGQTTTITTEEATNIFTADGQSCAAIPPCSHVSLHLKEVCLAFGDCLWVPLIVVVEDDATDSPSLTLVPKCRGAREADMEEPSARGDTKEPGSRVSVTSATTDKQTKTRHQTEEISTRVSVSSTTNKGVMIKQPKEPSTRVSVISATTNNEATAIREAFGADSSHTQQLKSLVFKNCQGLLNWQTHQQEFVISTLSGGAPSQLKLGKNVWLFENNIAIDLSFDTVDKLVGFDVMFENDNMDNKHLLALWVGNKPQEAQMKHKKYYFDTPGIYKGCEGDQMKFDVWLNEQIIAVKTLVSTRTFSTQGRPCTSIPLNSRVVLHLRKNDNMPANSPWAIALLVMEATLSKGTESLYGSILKPQLLPKSPGNSEKRPSTVLCCGDDVRKVDDKDVSVLYLRDMTGILIRGPNNSLHRAIRVSGVEGVTEVVVLEDGMVSVGDGVAMMAAEVELGTVIMFDALRSDPEPSPFMAILMWTPATPRPSWMVDGEGNMYYYDVEAVVYNIIGNLCCLHVCIENKQKSIWIPKKQFVDCRNTNEDLKIHDAVTVHLKNGKDIMGLNEWLAIALFTNGDLNELLQISGVEQAQADKKSDDGRSNTESERDDCQPQECYSVHDGMLRMGSGGCTFAYTVEGVKRSMAVPTDIAMDQPASPSAQVVNFYLILHRDSQRPVCGWFERRSREVYVEHFQTLYSHNFEDKCLCLLRQSGEQSHYIFEGKYLVMGKTRSQVGEISNRGRLVHAVVEEIEPCVVGGQVIDRRAIFLTSNSRLCQVALRFLALAEVDNVDTWDKHSHTSLSSNGGGSVSREEDGTWSSRSHTTDFKHSRTSLSSAFGSSVGEEESGCVSEVASVTSTPRKQNSRGCVSLPELSHNQLGKLNLSCFPNKKFPVNLSVPADRKWLCRKTLRQFLACGSLDEMTYRHEIAFPVLLGLVEDVYGGSSWFHCKELHNPLNILSGVPRYGWRRPNSSAKMSYLLASRKFENEKVIYQPLFLWPEGGECDPYIVTAQHPFLLDTENRVIGIEDEISGSRKCYSYSYDSAFSLRGRKSVKEFMHSRQTSFYAVVEDTRPEYINKTLVEGEVYILTSSYNVALAGISTLIGNHTIGCYEGEEVEDEPEKPVHSSMPQNIRGVPSIEDTQSEILGQTLSIQKVLGSNEVEMELQAGKPTRSVISTNTKGASSIQYTEREVPDQVVSTREISDGNKAKTEAEEQMEAERGPQLFISPNTKDVSSINDSEQEILSQLFIVTRSQVETDSNDVKIEGIKGYTGLHSKEMMDSVEGKVCQPVISPNAETVSGSNEVMPESTSSSVSSPQKSERSCKISQLFHTYKEMQRQAVNCPNGLSYQVVANIFTSEHKLRRIGMHGHLHPHADGLAIVEWKLQKTTAICSLSGFYYKGTKLNSWDDVDVKHRKSTFAIVLPLEQPLTFNDVVINALTVFAWICGGPRLVTVHQCERHEFVVTEYTDKLSTTTTATHTDLSLTCETSQQVDWHEHYQSLIPECISDGLFTNSVTSHPELSLTSEPSQQECGESRSDCASYSEAGKHHIMHIGHISCSDGTTVFSVHPQVVQLCGLQRKAVMVKYLMGDLMVFVVKSRTDLVLCNDFQEELIWGKLSDIHVRGNRCTSWEKLLKIKKLDIIVTDCPAVVLCGKTVSLKAVIGFSEGDELVPGIHVCSDHTPTLVQIAGVESAVARAVFSDIEVVWEQIEECYLYLTKMKKTQHVETAVMLEIVSTGDHVEYSSEGEALKKLDIASPGNPAIVECSGVVDSTNDETGLVMVLVQHNANTHPISLHRSHLLGHSTQVSLSTLIDQRVMVALQFMYYKNRDRVWRVVAVWANFQPRYNVSSDKVSSVICKEELCCPRSVLIRCFENVHNTDMFTVFSGSRYCVEDNKDVFICSSGKETELVSCEQEYVLNDRGYDDGDWNILVHQSTLHSHQSVIVQGIGAWRASMKDIAVQVCKDHGTRLIGPLLATIRGESVSREKESWMGNIREEKESLVKREESASRQKESWMGSTGAEKENWSNGEKNVSREGEGWMENVAEERGRIRGGEGWMGKINEEEKGWMGSIGEEEEDLSNDRAVLMDKEGVDDFESASEYASLRGSVQSLCSNESNSEYGSVCSRKYDDREEDSQHDDGRLSRNDDVMTWGNEDSEEGGGEGLGMHKVEKQGMDTAEGLKSVVGNDSVVSTVKEDPVKCSYLNSEEIGGESQEINNGEEQEMEGTQQGIRSLWENDSVDTVRDENSTQCTSSHKVDLHGIQNQEKEEIDKAQEDIGNVWKNVYDDISRDGKPSQTGYKEIELPAEECSMKPKEGKQGVEEIQKDTRSVLENAHVDSTRIEDRTQHRCTISVKDIDQTAGRDQEKPKIEKQQMDEAKEDTGSVLGGGCVGSALDENRRQSIGNITYRDIDEAASGGQEKTKIEKMKGMADFTDITTERSQIKHDKEEMKIVTGLINELSGSQEKPRVEKDEMEKMTDPKKLKVEEKGRTDLPTQTTSSFFPQSSVENFNIGVRIPDVINTFVCRCIFAERESAVLGAKDMIILTLKEDFYRDGVKLKPSSNLKEELEKVTGTSVSVLPAPLSRSISKNQQTITHLALVTYFGKRPAAAQDIIAEWRAGIAEVQVTFLPEDKERSRLLKFTFKLDCTLVSKLISQPPEERVVKHVSPHTGAASKTMSSSQVSSQNTQPSQAVSQLFQEKSVKLISSHTGAVSKISSTNQVKIPEWKPIVENIEIIIRMPSQIQSLVCRTVVKENDFLVLMAQEIMILALKNYFYRDGTQVPPSCSLGSQLKNMPGTGISVLPVRITKPVTVQKKLVTHFAIVSYIGKKPEAAHDVITKWRKGQMESVTRVYVKQEGGLKLMSFSIRVENPASFEASVVNQPQSGLKSVTQVATKVMPPKTEPPKQAPVTRAPYVNVRVLGRGKELETNCARLVDLRKESGFLEAGHEKLGGNVNIFFWREVVYINRQPPSRTHTLASLLEPKKRELFGCLAHSFFSKRKGDTRTIAGREVHFMAKLVWYGEKPSEEEIKAQVSLGGSGATQMAMNTASERKSNSLPSLVATSTTTPGITRQPAQKPNHPTEPTAVQQMTKHSNEAVSASEVNVIRKGHIMEIYQVMGRLQGEGDELLYFLREKCFLFGICLSIVDLWHVLSIGDDVEYEVTDRGRGMELKGVWVGGTAAQDPTTLLSALYTWCHDHNVPETARNVLLMKAGGLFPEFAPMVDPTQDQHKEVVDLS